jgi:hypothetical protein
MRPRPWRAVRAETFTRSRRRVAPRAVAQVGEDVLDDGVVAVLALGRHERVGRVGEGVVIPPGGEQPALPRGGLLVPVADPADDQPGGDRPAWPAEGCAVMVDLSAEPVPGVGGLRHSEYFRLCAAQLGYAPWLRCEFSTSLSVIYSRFALL